MKWRGWLLSFPLGNETLVPFDSACVCPGQHGSAACDGIFFVDYLRTAADVDISEQPSHRNKRSRKNRAPVDAEKWKRALVDVCGSGRAHLWKLVGATVSASLASCRTALGKRELGNKNENEKKDTKHLKFRIFREGSRTGY